MRPDLGNLEKKLSPHGESWTYVEEIRQRRVARRRGTQHTDKNAKRRSSSTDSADGHRWEDPEAPITNRESLWCLIHPEHLTPNTQHPARHVFASPLAPRPSPLDPRPSTLLRPLHPYNAKLPGESPVTPELTAPSAARTGELREFCGATGRHKIFSRNGLAPLCARLSPSGILKKTSRPTENRGTARADHRPQIHTDGHR